ncbi:MAG: DnaJ domain-containing protein [Bdellovibrionota bacterium]
MKALVIIFSFIILAPNAFAAKKSYDQYFSPNLYIRLGIEQNATTAQIKTAYRKLAFKLHPDRNLGSEEEVTEPFKKIQEAYDTLSNSAKRAQYDTVLRPNTHDMKADSWLPEDFDYRKEQEKIFRLMEKHPELQSLGEYVLSKWIKQGIPEEVIKQYQKYQELGKNFDLQYPAEAEKLREAALKFRDYVVSKGHPYYDPFDPNYNSKGRIWVDSVEDFYLWPTDIDTVKIVIRTGNPFLLRQVVMSMLNIPGWDQHEDLLLEIISKNNKIVNHGIGAFFYYPQWVNKRGAKILRKFLELGYSAQVAQSLGLAGDMPIVDHTGKFVRSETWRNLPEGIQLMKQLILVADQATLARLDQIQFDSSSAPWSQTMRSLPEFRDLPYISTAKLKTALISAGEKPRLLTNQITCKSLFGI